MQTPRTDAAFWSAFWALAKPYWVSEGRRKGVILLCAVIGFTLALVWIEVQFNDWNKGFYDTFEHKDRLGFYLELGRFSFLALMFIVLAVYKQYLQQMLMIEWRAWLTDTYLADWLAGQAYYRLQLLDRGTDNPDQRIADDLNGFVDLTLSLSLGLLSALVTLVSFVGILWVISGPLEVGGVTIPGYMVWVALVYAIAGTALTHLIGKPLIAMNFARQRAEADFRFSLVRLRENSEGVALYAGEAGEMANFKGRFGEVVARWWAIMQKQKQITWFTSFYGQMAIIFPFVVSAPRYFSGGAPLGSIFQTASAFGQVQGALSWFIGAYPSFAAWKATVDRLTGFTEALRRAREEADELDGDRMEGTDAGLRLENLAISLPQGRPLHGRHEPAPCAGGERVRDGAVGLGQSTLFRSIAGSGRTGRGASCCPRARACCSCRRRPTCRSGRCAPRWPTRPGRRSGRCRDRGCAGRGGARRAAGRPRARRELGPGPVRRRAAARRVRARHPQPAGLAVPRRGERGLAGTGTSRPVCPAARAPAADHAGLDRAPRQPRAVPRAAPALGTGAGRHATAVDVLTGAAWPALGRGFSRLRRAFSGPGARVRRAGSARCSWPGLPRRFPGSPRPGSARRRRRPRARGR